MAGGLAALLDDVAMIAKLTSVTSTKAMAVVIDDGRRHPPLRHGPEPCPGTADHLADREGIVAEQGDHPGGGAGFESVHSLDPDSDPDDRRHLFVF